MIKSPPGWGADMLTQAYQSVTSARPGWLLNPPGTVTVRRIQMADLRWALQRGLQDFGASRTDIAFLCIIYPVVGLLLGRVAFGYDMLPLLFPLASGFALIGPLAAVGLNEMSRRRELGIQNGFADAFAVFRSPAIGGIILLGLVLLMMLLFWLALSHVVYNLTLGPQPPASIGAFLHNVFFTHAGRAMAVIGIASGFVLAVIAFTISVVSFPMLLDRNVSLETAVRTSVRTVALNPQVMAAWALIIVAGLVVGSIPLLLGLIIVMPVLGHATWHLYRRIVPQ